MIYNDCKHSPRRCLNTVLLLFRNRGLAIDPVFFILLKTGENADKRWNPRLMSTRERLRDTVHQKLGDAQFIVVSNREPYMHEYRGGQIRPQKTISGLVTALDPVLQACGGIWVASGSGSADREVVDGNDCIRVPPEHSQYTLRRVWLTKEEEGRYYYGYSNQALWPLSHIAYRQPTFDAKDWEFYDAVNKKFADAVLDSCRDGRAFVWLQDYHLVRCAKHLRDRNPNLIVSLFWHIPWPNPEVFRICPQRLSILEGLLANDMLGFHIRYHCNNFLSTVELELEAKVDWEELSVTYQGHKTLVRHFPISVDDDEISSTVQSPEATVALRNLPVELEIPFEYLAMSVDRVDYTKGIPEKIRAVDRFLEKYPAYQGKFVFLQLGVLSRIRLRTYKQLIDDIQALAEEVNWKYRMGSWQPIVLMINRRFTYPAYLAHYRGADVFLVGSLHDGMNLVAKEYVMANVDYRGMLVLSHFTGAARELKEAVLVNPYDTEGFADAIKEALEMPNDEKQRRMDRMQTTIREHNIFWWAEKYISSLMKLT